MYCKFTEKIHWKLIRSILCDFFSVLLWRNKGVDIIAQTYRIDIYTTWVSSSIYRNLYCSILGRHVFVICSNGPLGHVLCYVNSCVITHMAFTKVRMYVLLLIYEDLSSCTSIYWNFLDTIQMCQALVSLISCFQIQKCKAGTGVECPLVLYLQFLTSLKLQ